MTMTDLFDVHMRTCSAPSGDSWGSISVQEVGGSVIGGFFSFISNGLSKLIVAWSSYFFVRQTRPVPHIFALRTPVEQLEEE